MFGFGNKDNTQTNPQTSPTPSSAGNIGVQVNGQNPAPFDPNFNMNPISDPFASQQFNPQFPAQQNFAAQPSAPTPPQFSPQPMQAPQPPLSQAPPAPVNLPTPTSINPGPILQADQGQVGNGPMTPDVIINSLKNNQTFKLENYEFGFDPSKVAEGNAFWEKGPTGTVYGDESGLREFLSEQSLDTLNEISTQLTVHTEPAPFIPQPTPAPTTEPTIQIQAPTPARMSNPDPVFDKAKLANFVEFYEGLEEAYKLAKTYIESAE
jgi:hypothetical protein